MFIFLLCNRSPTHKHFYNIYVQYNNLRFGKTREELFCFFLLCTLYIHILDICVCIYRTIAYVEYKMRRTNIITTSHPPARSAKIASTNIAYSKNTPLHKTRTPSVFFPFRRLRRCRLHRRRVCISLTLCLYLRYTLPRQYVFIQPSMKHSFFTVSTSQSYWDSHLQQNEIYKWHVLPKRL